MPRFRQSDKVEIYAKIIADPYFINAHKQSGVYARFLQQRFLSYTPRLEGSAGRHT